MLPRARASSTTPDLDTEGVEVRLFTAYYSPAGDWTRHGMIGSMSSRLVWYVSYGSNMNAERFACYLARRTPFWTAADIEVLISPSPSPR
ncbi:hypothetical protein [Saccharothrix deserti]|uniref:hypothetical protein n=1 Tax=Saccharothrix deserti TaxID=2593674 RepID=UPI00131C564D|nr:hypothetical protein [Saccharothrix deserti]